MESIKIKSVEHCIDGLIKEVHEMEDGSSYLFGFYRGRLEFSYKIKLERT